MKPKEAGRQLHKLAILFDKYEKSHLAKVEAVRSQCEHDWVYEPDPSGNNDSGHYCSGCGTWTKREP